MTLTPAAMTDPVGVLPEKESIQRLQEAYYKLVWEVIGIARSAGYDDVALSARAKP